MFELDLDSLTKEDLAEGHVGVSTLPNLDKFEEKESERLLYFLLVLWWTDRKCKMNKRCD